MYTYSCHESFHIVFVARTSLRTHSFTDVLKDTFSILEFSGILCCTLIATPQLYLITSPVTLEWNFGVIRTAEAPHTCPACCNAVISSATKLRQLLQAPSLCSFNVATIVILQNIHHHAIVYLVLGIHLPCTWGGGYKKQGRVKICTLWISDITGKNLMNLYLLVGLNGGYITVGPMEVVVIQRKTNTCL
jgi:hypothetical protein